MSSFKPGAVFNPRDNTNRGRKQSFDDNKKNILQISNDCMSILFYSLSGTQLRSFSDLSYVRFPHVFSVFSVQ
jgi:hypothetical protein